MTRFLALCLLLAACMQAAAAATTAAVATDDPAAVAQINRIVRDFQAAIVARDGKALEAMFLSHDNSWLTVTSAAIQVPAGKSRLRASHYKEFADFVANSKLPVEERFYNVRVHSNGSVGMVYFDFDFLVGGKVTNKGSESWHLVLTEEGWKISSMVYSAG